MGDRARRQTIVVGPQGASIPGPQGYQGHQGHQGYQGAIGTGAQGNQGYQGYQGHQGNQGNQGNQGSQGYQGNQGASATLSDDSVSYAKIGADLKSKQAIGALDVDWNAGAVFTKTITGNSTLTFSNLKLNKVVTAVISGAFTLAFPAYCKRIVGTYNGAVSNYIQMHCTSDTSGSEEVWYTINQPL